ncbi:MAG TPA: DNA-processing protein DprA [Candidatus Saccharimonadales bacterium]|nr:DNA-processing protein DprA [Candidatus Saccharimonadales bacterium]
MQISEISYKDAVYPDQLREISSPPQQLFTLGSLPQGPFIAIVGTRRPTQYGRHMAYRLSSELAAAGVVIVSGLALGIDAVAHQAAVEAGGVTVAVLGCGLDAIYPSSNRTLARNILDANGTIISEYPKGTPPLRHHFPARNRIIAGLSCAVVIPEADASSGSLITANFALEQNRTVMAVPGNTTSLRSAGPNNLIKSGATPITGSSDILAALDLEAPQLAKSTVTAKSREEALVLELLSQGVTTTAELITRSHMTAGQFANVITLMEITGKVRNLGAGSWIGR